MAHVEHERSTRLYAYVRRSGLWNGFYQPDELQRTDEKYDGQRVHPSTSPGWTILDVGW